MHSRGGPGHEYLFSQVGRSSVQSANGDLGGNLRQRSGRVGSKEKTKVSRKAQLRDKNVVRL